MNTEEFIAEMKSKYSSYSKSGVLSEVDIVTWMYRGLLPFGNYARCLQDGMVSVKNTSGCLPSNFSAIESVYLYDKLGYHVEDDSKGVLQNSVSWLERTERTAKWNMCDPCCITEEMKVVKEEYYFKGAKACFYYCNPKQLCIGTEMKRNFNNKVYDKLGKSDVNTVYIQGKTIQTNFDEGDLYITYYGWELDSEGRPEIPESYNGNLYEYLDYYVTKKLLEKLRADSRAKIPLSDIQWYSRESDKAKGAAMSEMKMNSIDPVRLGKTIKRFNRNYATRLELI